LGLVKFQKAVREIVSGPEFRKEWLWQVEETHRNPTCLPGSQRFEDVHSSQFSQEIVSKVHFP
jgi:hypothetical protein